MQDGTSHSDASRKIAKPPGQLNAPATVCLNRPGSARLAITAHREPLSMGLLAG